MDKQNQYNQYIVTMSGTVMQNNIIAPVTSKQISYDDVNKKVVDLKEYELTEEGRINPFNTGNKPITSNWVQNLLKKYDIYQNINNLELYQQSFVHTSYTIPYIKEICLRDNVGIKENPDGCMLLFQSSYERMEFLGDTIIDAIIGNYIYMRFPNSDEGFLSTMKKQLVSRWTLGHLADKCGFGEYMIISKTLDLKNDARKDIKKLCDVLEAFVAAIYLDFNAEKNGFLSTFLSGPGYQVAEKFVINLLEHPDSLVDITSLIMDDGNYKIKLRNLLRRMRQTDPIYTHELQSDSTYIVKITTKKNRDIILAKGIGADSKDAEYTAAHNALLALGAI